MQTARSRLLCILIGFTVATPLMFVPPLKAQDDCRVMYKALTDAQVKLHSTPAHVYTTSKIGSQTFLRDDLCCRIDVYEDERQMVFGRLN